MYCSTLLFARTLEISPLPKTLYAWTSPAVVVSISTLVKAGTDLMEPRNLAIVAIILVFGIGGMSFDLAVVKLGGIGLAGIIGVLLNLLLPGKAQN